MYVFIDAVEGSQTRMLKPFFSSSFVYLISVKREEMKMAEPEHLVDAHLERQLTFAVVIYLFDQSIFCPRKI